MRQVETSHKVESVALVNTTFKLGPSSRLKTPEVS